MKTQRGEAMVPRRVSRLFARSGLNLAKLSRWVETFAREVLLDAAGITVEAVIDL